MIGTSMEIMVYIKCHIHCLLRLVKLDYDVGYRACNENWKRPYTVSSTKVSTATDINTNTAIQAAAIGSISLPNSLTKQLFF